MKGHVTKKGNKCYFGVGADPETGKRKQSGGLSPQTVRYYHAILREALGHAVKWQLFNRNVRYHHIRTRRNHSVSRIYQRISFIYRFPACNLHWTKKRRNSWSTLVRKPVSIRKNLVLVNNKTVLQEPKTKGSNRIVTLPSTAIEALKVADMNYPDRDLVVATSVGTHVSPRNLLRSFH